MSWRQFAVAMVQALAWPAVVVAVLVAYRRRVSDLLGDNLRRLKAGTIEAEWEKVAEEARATIEAVDALPDISDGQGERSDVVKLLGLARAFVDVEPRLAIRHAWDAALLAFEAHLPSGEGLREIRTFGKLLKTVRTRGLVNPGAALVLEQLRTLRNVGIHSAGQAEETTAEQAKEFIQLVEDFLTLLEKPTAISSLQTPSPAAERPTA